MGIVCEICNSLEIFCESKLSQCKLIRVHYIVYVWISILQWILVAFYVLGELGQFERGTLLLVNSSPLSDIGVVRLVFNSWTLEQRI